MLSSQEQTTDTAAFWQFVKRHFRLLISFSLLGGLMAIVFTLFIPKEYKSYGIVYPPSSTSIENSIDFPNFGYDVEADRLMQILEGREIRDSVIAKFNLLQYFEIDSSRADWNDELLKLYYKNIKLERTTSMAVLITARSKDPNLSADIVNYIIKSADNFRDKLYKRNLTPAYEEALKEYELQQSKVDTAEHRLSQHLKENHLSSLLLLYSDAQISVDIDRISASSAGKESSAYSIGAEIINYKSMFEVMKDAKARLIKIRKTILNPIPKIFVISYAEPHYKKISPSFTVNALIGALLALSITVIVLLTKQSREQN
jgi:uncharacterized protein involved in exopolysaccharide biosynthesis